MICLIQTCHLMHVNTLHYLSDVLMHEISQRPSAGESYYLL